MYVCPNRLLFLVIFLSGCLIIAHVYIYTCLHMIFLFIGGREREGKYAPHISDSRVLHQVNRIRTKIGLEAKPYAPLVDGKC